MIVSYNVKALLYFIDVVRGEPMFKDKVALGLEPSSAEPSSDSDKSTKSD